MRSKTRAGRAGGLPSAEPLPHAGPSRADPAPLTALIQAHAIPWWTDQLGNLREVSSSHSQPPATPPDLRSAEHPPPLGSTFWSWDKTDSCEIVICLCSTVTAP